MPIYDYATHSPGVETPGYRLKPVKTGSGDVVVLDHRIQVRGLLKCFQILSVSQSLHEFSTPEQKP
jgi:hypothetical protein